MASVETGRFTLDVGGDVGLGLIGTVRVSGALAAEKELPKGAEVRVVVTDADGELVATSLGRVRSIAFKRHEEKHGGHWTERLHGIKLD